MERQYDSLIKIAKRMKQKIKDSKDDTKNYNVLIFAYNKTGKTRLSYEFKSLGQEKDENGEALSSDTLYYNAFTEDLFYWDNDLESDIERKLKFRRESKFFNFLGQRDIEPKIREILSYFADFDFDIDYNDNSISFKIKKQDDKEIKNIKISRGEESLFIICFFLAIVEIILLESEEEKTYSWVKYIYIDDPVSSLDENHIIKLAIYIAHLFKEKKKKNENNTESEENSENIDREIDNDTELRKIPVIVSTHHTLFFNVLYNEWKREQNIVCVLKKEYFNNREKYILESTKDTPFFYHIDMLEKLIVDVNNKNIYRYHFPILRGILEKTASFLGYNNFGKCIEISEEEKEKYIDNKLSEEALHTRLINLLSHEKYSLLDYKEIVEDNKVLFKDALKLFLSKYNFKTNNKLDDSKYMDNSKSDDLNDDANSDDTNSINIDNN